LIALLQFVLSLVVISISVRLFYGNYPPLPTMAQAALKMLAPIVAVTAILTAFSLFLHEGALLLLYFVLLAFSRLIAIFAPRIACYMPFALASQAIVEDRAFAIVLGTLPSLAWIATALVTVAYLANHKDIVK
jgi:hypothetical protein